MREMEIQSSRAQPLEVLRLATALLAALQRDQRRAFSRLMRLQERNVEQLQMLLHNRRVVKRGDT